MRDQRATITDVRSVQAAVDRAHRSLQATAQEDVVVDNRKLLLRSPNGHYWNITVSNAGVLSAVDMGTSL